MALENLVDLVQLFPGNPDIRARETSKIEDPVEHCHRLRTELAVYILLVNDDGVLRLIEAEREVGLAQPVDSSKYRVSLRPFVYPARIGLRM